MGGIVPTNQKASHHLTSRMMTGQALSSHGIPLAEIRASILLETCSASYLMVYYLAKRLSLMITPNGLISSVRRLPLRMQPVLLRLLLNGISSGMRYLK